MTVPTDLVLSGDRIPPYSARGLRHTLEPIGGATSLRRTVNGALKDVSDPVFRKFQTTIRGGDMDPPALDGVWPGLTLTVDCAVEFAKRWTGTEPPSEDGTDADLERPAVPGSVRLADGFAFYRPRLTMLVTGFSVDRDEWGAVNDWQLNLEEV